MDESRPSPAPRSGSTDDVPVHPPRARRWALVLGGGLLGLVGVLVLAVWVALSSLDHPWLKPRLLALVTAKTGLELDYRAARLSLTSGLRIDTLVVKTPAELRARAPELARVGQLRVRWSPATLRAASIRDVELEHVALTVVLDEHGRSSFDAIPEVAPKAAEPAVPLSRRADALLGAPLPLQRVHVSDVSATLVRTERAAEVERDVLRGLAATVDVARAGTGSAVTLTVGTAAAGLPLFFEQTRADATASARLLASISLEATPTQAKLALELAVRAQDLLPALPVRQLASLAAHATFEAVHGRTRVEVTQLRAADGALQGQAQLELPDRGTPRVHSALADIDAPHLLRLAEPFHVPLAVAHGELHVRVQELALDGFSERTHASVQGELRGLSLTLAGATGKLAAAHIALEGQPRANALSLSGEVTLHGAQLVQPGRLLALDDARVTLSGTRSASGTLDAHVALHTATLDAPPARVRDAALELRAQQLVLDPNAPLASHGDLTLRGRIARVELAMPGQPQVEATPIELRAHLPLHGGAPFTLAAELEAGRVRSRGAQGQLLVDMPVDLELGLHDVHPDLAQPLRTRGSVHVGFDAGPLHAVLDADKQLDALGYRVHSDAAQLAALRPFLPPALVAHVPWDKLGFALGASGQLERISSREPLLRAQTSLTLDRPAFDDVGARKLELELGTHGTRMHHDLQAELRVGALHIGDQQLGDEQVTLSAALDRAQPSVHVQLASARLPKSSSRVDLAFERKERALVYHVHSQAAQFAPLAPLLAAFAPTAGFDLAGFALALDAEGKLTGVIDDIDARGTIHSAPHIAAGAGGHGKVAVELERLRWSMGDVAVGMPAASWRATLHGDGSQRTLDSELTSEHVDLGLASHRIGITGLHDHTTITVTGDRVLGTIDHVETTSIRAIEQRVVPMYRLGDLRAKVVARRTGDGMIKLSTLELDNVAGGTSLSLSGGFDLEADRQRMSIRGTAKQDLARLSNRHDLFVGRGQAALEVTLASPDFSLFYTRTKLALDDASIELPAQQVKVSSMNGEVPILADFAVGSGGVEVLRGAQVNPYAAQRFSDQHPLLNHRSFLSIASIATPLVSIAPFAANLKVERNIVSLSQVELGVRHGTITGNGILEYDGVDSKLETNIRASNVLSSHGEPFDGNAALVMGLRDRSIEGRADILRIGRRHLLDLIDLQDPRRVDAALNHIRTGLRFGYPDRVRLAFEHGFASAGVELGGLARLIKIRDVRGIAIGPLMERVLRSLEPAAEEP